ncbi:MAG: hypothetical protein PHF00_03780 [Elusimicrobia bacterium]|nr:hypothetical protein [Elusimicrobiota bacterium]
MRATTIIIAGVVGLSAGHGRAAGQPKDDFPSRIAFCAERAKMMRAGGWPWEEVRTMFYGCVGSKRISDRDMELIFKKDVVAPLQPRYPAPDSGGPCAQEARALLGAGYPRSEVEARFYDCISRTAEKLRRFEQEVLDPMDRRFRSPGQAWP